MPNPAPLTDADRAAIESRLAKATRHCEAAAENLERSAASALAAHAGFGLPEQFQQQSAAIRQMLTDMRALLAENKRLAGEVEALRDDSLRIKRDAIRLNVAALWHDERAHGDRDRTVRSDAILRLKEMFFGDEWPQPVRFENGGNVYWDDALHTAQRREGT